MPFVMPDEGLKYETAEEKKERVNVTTLISL